MTNCLGGLSAGSSVFIVGIFGGINRYIKNGHFRHNLFIFGKLCLVRSQSRSHNVLISGERDTQIFYLSRSRNTVQVKFLHSKF